MKSLLPCTATPLEKSLGELTARLESIPVETSTLYNAAECPSALLPWLAWAFSVDFLPSDEATRRRVIAKSLPLHQKKGTRAAVVEACARLNYRVNIIEGWSTTPPKPAHTFEVRLLKKTPLAYGPHDYDTLAQTIDAVKPARSHYEMSVHLSTAIKINIHVASTMIQTFEFTATPFYPIKPCVLAIGLFMPVRIEQHLHSLT